MILFLLKREFFCGLLAGWIIQMLIGELFISRCVFQAGFYQRSNESSDTTIKLAENTATSSLTLRQTTTQNIPSPEQNFLRTNCKNSSQFSRETTSSGNYPDFNLAKATQEERKTNMKASCRRIFPKVRTCKEENKDYIHERNLISRNYKVVVCDIYKCGFTSWLSAILVMENIFPADKFLNATLQSKKERANAEKTVRLSSIANHTLKKELWNNSLKVLTVRNPFSRLVSAYYGKLVATSRGHSSYYQAFSRKISNEFRHLRHNKTERNQTYDGNATFEDFANYLLTLDVLNNYWDGHFISYILGCKPCDVEYDYVIKFESLYHDIEYLKQKLNISDYHRKAVFPRKDFKINEDVVKKTFATIPDNLALKLYLKYKKDFDIFGYEKPKWLPLCLVKENSKNRYFYNV